MMIYSSGLDPASSAEWLRGSVITISVSCLSQDRITLFIKKLEATSKDFFTFTVRLDSFKFCLLGQLRKKLFCKSKVLNLKVF